MANKTFTVNSTSPTAGQALDAASVGVHVTGTINGQFVIEVAPSDANYAPAHPPLNGASTGGVLYFAIAIPSGWYVRVRPVNTTGTPAFAVTVG